VTLRLRAWVGSPLDALRFTLRSRVAFRRGPPRLAHEPKDALFDYLPDDEVSLAEARERELRARYRLEPLYAQSTRLDYRDNVALLDALEALVGSRPLVARGAGPASVVDVGSKNFSYAFALERFFRRAIGDARGLAVLGVEVDGHVVYRDLRSRRDHAEAYAAQTGNPDVRYLVADFCELEAGPFDFATLLFPFMTRHALERWGLPARFFAPERLIERAAQLTPHGDLLVLSQTEEERDILVGIAGRVGLRVVATCPIPSKLVHYHAWTDDRHATRLHVG